jgi:hypothetical protein
MIYDAVNIFVNTKKDKERKESQPSLLISLRCQKKRKKKKKNRHPTIPSKPSFLQSFIKPSKFHCPFFSSELHFPTVYA